MTNIIQYKHAIKAPKGRVVLEYVNVEILKEIILNQL